MIEHNLGDYYEPDDLDKGSFFSEIESVCKFHGVDHYIIFASKHVLDGKTQMLANKNCPHILLPFYLGWVLHSFAKDNIRQQISK